MILEPPPDDFEALFLSLRVFRSQVGPRQLCAQLLAGSGPCVWDLDCLVPEEDRVGGELRSSFFLPAR